MVVVMSVRLPLPLRNVEDLLFERGIDLCHETVRLWWDRSSECWRNNRGRRVGRLPCPTLPYPTLPYPTLLTHDQAPFDGFELPELRRTRVFFLQRTSITIRATTGRANSRPCVKVATSHTIGSAIEGIAGRHSSTAAHSATCSRGSTPSAVSSAMHAGVAKPSVPPPINERFSCRVALNWFNWSPRR